MKNHRAFSMVFIAGILTSFSSIALADHPSIGLGIGAATPICTLSAVPVPKGMWSIGGQVEFHEFDDFSDQTLSRLSEEDPDADIHSVDSLFSLVGGMAYGLTDDLNIGLRLPYIQRNNIREAAHHHDEESEADTGASDALVASEENQSSDTHEAVTNRGDSEGLGDLTLYGQYRFYKNLEMKAHAAFLVGIKTPTGTTDETDEPGERFETEMQPGSGSWDPLFGLALTKQWSRLSFDTSYLYSIATEGAQDTDLGDSFVYNFALSYRFGGDQDAGGYHHHEYHDEHDHAGGHPHVMHPAVDLIVELNGEWRAKEETGGETDDNSGGHTLYLSPGVRFTTGNGLAASISTGLPVLTDLNGHQVEPEYRLLGSLSWCF